FVVCDCAILVYVYVNFSIHSRTKFLQHFGLIRGGKFDFDGKTLDGFYEVSRRVVGWKDRKSRSGSWGERSDFGLKFSVGKSIDFDDHFLAGDHFVELCLLEVGYNPSFIVVDNIEQRCAGLNQLSGLKADF